MTKLPAVFLLSNDAYELAFGRDERAALDDLVTLLAPPLTEATWTAQGDVLRHAEAIFSGWETPLMDERLLATCPALRVVFHAAGSIKFMVTDAFWARGIRITSAARANGIPVAEFTFAQIVLALKHAWSAAATTRANRRFVQPVAGTPSGYGSTVGILSFGLIGRMVADRLRSLEVRVIGYDPYLSTADAQALGVERVSLDALFSQADVVTCHTPLLPETRHLLRARHFAAMKPGATFINTARGAIVNEGELVAVLRERPDLFAVLDVTDPEPPAPDSPLYTLPNVLLTPHISGSIGAECRRMSQFAIAEARRYVAGEALVGEIVRTQLPLLA